MVITCLNLWPEKKNSSDVLPMSKIYDVHEGNVFSRIELMRYNVKELHANALELVKGINKYLLHYEYIIYNTALTNSKLTYKNITFYEE
jgi:hypothetical protein